MHTTATPPFTRDANDEPMPARDQAAVEATPDDRAVHAALPMTIPGSPESAARKVQSISPEGRPAQGDAKAGPGRMALEVGLVAIVVLVAALGVSLWFGWVAGLASLGVGLLALMFNPVIGAVAMRMEERAEVIHHDSDDPAGS